MEAFLAAVLDKVLVAANPSRLKGLKSKTCILSQKFQAELHLRGELLELIRDKVDREGELVNTSLAAKRSSIFLVLGKEQALKERTMISSP